MTVIIGWTLYGRGKSKSLLKNTAVINNMQGLVGVGVNCVTFIKR